MEKRQEGIEFFHARIARDRVETDGEPNCTCGWPLSRHGNEGEEGVFASWRWDGKRLTVRNDRYGFYPLYYFVRDGEIALSPSIPRLLDAGAPAELDYRALSVFLRFGSFIREDTPFTYIRALPPGCRLAWSRDSFTVSGGRVRTQKRTIPLDDAITVYRDLFRDAIRRRLPPSYKFVVPLSGGMDSRHILLELCQQGYKPCFCLTSQYFAPFVSSDVEIASAVAEAAGVRHLVIDPGISEFKGELWKHSISSLGSLDSGWMYAMAEVLGERADTIYDGIGGDILSSDGMMTQENYRLS